jgi:threonine dehydratase
VAATDESVEVTQQDILNVRSAVAKVVRHTPVLPTQTISDQVGAKVLLKAENLQLTGSFKLRGAIAKLTTLGEEGRKVGVVAASAGNHAQGLAEAARFFGVRCEVFLPDTAAIHKIESTRARGAIVHIGGSSVEDCIVSARERAQEGGLVFVHPFDDPAVIAGQGSIGLELLEDVPDLAKVVVPVGGGGLSSGIAIAVKSSKPNVAIVGVQAANCSPYVESLQEGKLSTASSNLTIADGIGVKQPAERNLKLLAKWLDDIVVVEEDEIAHAMVLLLERSKLVVEGAGAVGVAALLTGKTEATPDGATVAILSGGNVDADLLAAVSRQHETEAGRRLVMITRLPDRPGALAELLKTIADTGANVVEVTHVREGLELHVRETAVELVLETRGREHADEVFGHLSENGYRAETLH